MNLERLDTMISEGRLIRRSWTGTDAEGRETACLLAALYPGCTDAGTCPADEIPPWLAYLTPWMDDAGSEAEWPSVVHRYAVVIRRIGEIPADRLATLDYRCRRIAVAEAARYSDDPSIAAVLALLDRRIAGDCPTDEEWAAARSASSSAASASSAAGAAWSADEASESGASDRMIDAMLSAIEGELS